MRNPARTAVAAATGRMSRASSDTAVEQITVPPTAQALSSLPRIDYAEAFLIETNSARQWSAERYAREVLDGAPLAMRGQLLLGWSAIGLKPAIGGATRSILGWQIRESPPEFVLLGRDSLIGMPGELLFRSEGDALLFCTFVQHTNFVARATWASIESRHVQIVRDLLSQAARRLAQ
jgi:hypothetical protein